MKFGICTQIENLPLFAETGLDFIEVNAAAITQKSEEDFAAAREIADRFPGKVLSCNGLVPSALRLTGPDVDFDAVTAYTEKCFGRIAALGVKTIVFGSSSAKKVPDGFSREEAMEQLVRVVRIFSDVAERYGQTVVIEPLNTGECNIINTVADSVSLMKAVDRQNVRAHVDFYHLMQNGETLSELAPQVQYIPHVHIASPIKRIVPTFDDGAHYGAFLTTLRENGFDGTVSYEGKSKLTEEMVRTLMSFLKSL